MCEDQVGPEGEPERPLVPAKWNVAAKTLDNSTLSTQDSKDSCTRHLGETTHALAEKFRLHGQFKEVSVTWIGG
jgi:hypothetical protein